MAQVKLSLIAVILLGGCATQLDKASVQATSKAPLSTQVQPISIPYNPSEPKFVLIVERTEVGVGSTAGSVQQEQRGSPCWGPWGWGFFCDQPAPGGHRQVGTGMSDRVAKAIEAQFISALSRVGNVVIIDAGRYRRFQNHPEALLESGEVGPFLLRVTITEFNETAEAVDRRQGISLGRLGATMGVIGALAGARGVGLAGGALAAANPTYENREAKRTGSVGLDIQLIDSKRGRILSSLTAKGTFSSISKTSGLSVFGIGGGESAFAASALGQATRAALNDAVQKLYGVLTRSY